MEIQTAIFGSDKRISPANLSAVHGHTRSWISWTISGGNLSSIFVESSSTHSIPKHPQTTFSSSSNDQ